MSSRPVMHRHNDGKSQEPLLARSPTSGRQSPSIVGYDSPRRPSTSRRSTFHGRDPEELARYATRKRYTYAAFFLLLSLVSFCVQTETASYIQKQLHWNKAYCMMYFTHGSWSLLWPTQLLILRLRKWNQPWPTFWRRHLQLVKQTAQMVQHQTLHLTARQENESPWPYMLRTTAFVTSALTVAGGSWYVAVDLTTSSDLTAIYNCSAFFAYAFSIPMLREKVRTPKVVAVAVAIAGVLIVAYGGGQSEHEGRQERANPEPNYRFFGNVVIGIGSVLYGFYEVLYKKVACPPDDCSPGRGMIFANTFGSMMGAFTLAVLWIPLPVLHWLGWETFELPRGEQAWMLAISVFANAVFSGSFLVLISLTSPVLSSVAALLTIFIIAIVDELLPFPLRQTLTPAAVIGGLCIIFAFLLLSWATWVEMNEEKKRRYSLGQESESDEEEEEV